MHIVETIQSRKQFLALQDNWLLVYSADPEAQYFLSWQWLWHLYERRDEPLQILAYRDSSASAHFQAFLPMRSSLHLSKRDSCFVQVCRPAGNFWADYTGLICTPEHESTAIPALVSALHSLPWQRLYLDDWHLSDSRQRILLAAFASDAFEVRHRSRRDNNGETDLSKAPCIDLANTFDGWLRMSVSANSRQRIRRLTRKFNSNPELVCRLSTGKRLNTDLGYFEQFWSDRWAKQKGSKLKQLADRYACIIEQAVDSDVMRLLILDHKDQPVGMTATYVDRKKDSLLFFVGARDTEFQLLPPGLLLHVFTIEWAIHHGFKRYDLLRGDERYKYSLGACDQQLQSLCIERVKSSSSASLLDPCHIDKALSKLRRHQRHAAAVEVEQLYHQLRLSWPTSLAVEQAHSDWQLRAAGN